MFEHQLNTSELRNMEHAWSLASQMFWQITDMVCIQCDGKLNVLFERVL